MKTNSLYIALLSLIALLSSCMDDVSMRTVVNTDGSCVREFSFPSDSAEMQGGENMRDHIVPSFKTDGWEKTWAKNDSTEKLRCTASQQFASVEEMAVKFPLQISGTPILKNCSFDKKFRWFYTEYTFTETYISLASGFTIPLSKYFDKDGLSYWFTGTPNLFEGMSGAEMKQYQDQFEEKYIDWIDANIVSDAIDVVVSHYDLIVDNPVALADFTAQRDSIISFAKEKQYSYINGKKHYGELFSEFFHTNCFADSWQEGNELYNALETRTGDYLSIVTLSVDYQLSLPGKDFTFRLSGERLLTDDYTISATSRQQNTWAYLVMILFVLLAVISFFFSKRSSQQDK